MRRIRHITPLVLLLLSTSMLTLLTARPGHAQCSYPAMTSGTAVYYPPGTVRHPTFVQSTNYWSAVAVRPDAGTDWDLSVNSGTAAYPTCVSGTLASSAYSGSAVDVVIGDFNHNAQGTFYVKPYLYSGPGGATVEWDDGPDQLSVNGPWISRATGPNDVIECWDVYLESGKRYFFTLLNSGDASLRLLFFQSPSATYWAGRSAATYETVPITNGSLGISWPSNTSDWLGVVVVNDNGLVSDYKLDVTTCLAPTPLASATPVTVTSPERQVSFTQTTTNFTAVGVRASNPSEDWGIETFAGPFDLTYGNCLQNLLAVSYFSPAKTEYVVGDFNAGANPINTPFYARALALSGAAGSAQVEWDSGPDFLVVDAPNISGSTNSMDVLAAWDVQLIAGQTYRFHFEHQQAADLRLGLFQNPGAGYWVPRASALEEHTSSFYFTAPATDRYGVVVVNDTNAPGTYQLGVGQCKTPFVISTDPLSGLPTPGLARLQFDAPQPAWTVMGERAWTLSENWDLAMYADALGGLPPVCFGNQLATSTQPAGTVDLVVGDLHSVSGDRRYYGYGTYAPGTTDYGMFEIDQGDTAIIVGDPPVTAVTSFNDVVKCWDVFLEAGTTYSVYFDRDGAADERLLVFGNPGGGGPEGYWTNRTTAALGAAGATTSTDFTPPSSGWYALVAVNENGGEGVYHVGVYAAGVAVGDPSALATRLEGVVPNPVQRGSRIQYALARPAGVSFEIVDAAGRRVSQVAEESRAAGRWNTAWSGAGDDGKRLGAGVYFLRMLVDGHVVEGSKFVLLP